MDLYLIKKPKNDLFLDKIEIETGIIKNLYHKSSNIKYYEQGDEIITKGSFFNSTKTNNIFPITNLSNIFKNKPVYNCFLIKSKKQGKTEGLKINGQERIGDIFVKIKDFSILYNIDYTKISVLSEPFSKIEIQEFLDNGKIVEIDTFNFEKINEKVEKMWNKFKKTVDK